MSVYKLPDDVLDTPCTRSGWLSLIEPIVVIMSAIVTQTTQEAVPGTTLQLRGVNPDENKETEPTSHHIANIEENSNYKYMHLLPVYDSTSYPPLVPFEHVDPGSRALSHESPRAFLANATRVTNLTPQIGTEVDGVQLLGLSDEARDQLALFVAQRGVVAFRNQLYFIDAGSEAYKKWGRYFGR